MECLVEYLEVLTPPEKYRRERPVEVLAILDARDLQRSQCVEHAIRPDRDAGFPEYSGEVHDVFG
jgi:hypothetical protein